MNDYDHAFSYFLLASSLSSFQKGSCFPCCYCRASCYHQVGVALVIVTHFFCSSWAVESPPPTHWWCPLFLGHETTLPLASISYRTLNIQSFVPLAFYHNPPANMTLAQVYRNQPNNITLLKSLGPGPTDLLKPSILPSLSPTFCPGHHPGTQFLGTLSTLCLLFPSWVLTLWGPLVFPIAQKSGAWSWCIVGRAIQKGTHAFLNGQ